MKKNITPMQQLFIEQYLISLNATQAAIKAGYSPNSAKEQGSRLLTYANIQEAIAEANKQRTEKSKVTQEYVLTNLRTIVERCMQAEPVLDKDGNETGIFKFNGSGATKALELIGKHLQMFTDKVTAQGLTHEQILKQIEMLSRD